VHYVSHDTLAASLECRDTTYRATLHTSPNRAVRVNSLFTSMHRFFTHEPRPVEWYTSTFDVQTPEPT
jgi:hypothetical protein